MQSNLKMYRPPTGIRKSNQYVYFIHTPPKVTLTKTNLDYQNFNSEPRIYKKQQV